MLRRWIGCVLLCLAAQNAGAQQAIGHCDQQACDWDVERGRPRPVIDTLGWLIGAPSKLLLWDRRAKNHHVSEDTIRHVTGYLRDRQLYGVKVRVNQYDPIGEWDRLVENTRISPGWKYTAGLLCHLRYTFLPGRVFGHDEYNPYTDSLSLYSDMPSLGMVEAAYARDVRQRECPGTYATLQTLPLISMWHETLATNEVITYIRVYGTKSQLREFRRDLYARYGVQLGNELETVLPDGSIVLQLAGAIAGHMAATCRNRTDDYPQ